MNALQDRLDAQARQMAFEMGFAPEPQAQPRPALANLRPCTQRQVAFIKQLLEERDVAPCVMEQVDIARGQVMRGALSSQGASALIEELLSSPKKQGSTSGWTREPLAPAEEPEDGIYVLKQQGLQDDIFKVYKMVHGSGRQGLKRLVFEPGAKKGRFEFEGLALYKLPKAARRMTLEEAKEFGALYSFCVRCGRTLTDEESIAAGIGPICAGKI